QRPFLLRVDDERFAGLPAQDERHDAVVARVGAGHHAFVAVDRPHVHAHMLTSGCDSYVVSLVSTSTDSPDALHQRQVTRSICSSRTSSSSISSSPPIV